MLDMTLLADWARSRARDNVNGGPSALTTRAYAALHQTFDKRILDACRRVPDNPSGVPDGLFIALPERLLSKCAYLCIGKARASSQDTARSRPSAVTDSMLACLREYYREGNQCVFANLELSDRTGQLKHVLLCHALSPIEDSILLLADIGRAHRVAQIMGFDVKILLADISWMRSNRSIRQFQSLSASAIDTGLRVCLDKRIRLYEALGMQPDRHEIVPYDKAGKISGKKLDHISSHYRALATALWGPVVDGRLEHNVVQRICQPLDVLPRLAEPEHLDALPHHMSTFGQFPGVLSTLEDTLKPHVEILRVIAKQFTSFDAEIFAYFFAQYYAQDLYRGSTLKIAPISERPFDEPFDKLDRYFRAWGDGHSTTSVMTRLDTGPVDQVAPLSVGYAPQYAIGSLAVLPYTPLSLTALRQEPRDHSLIASRLIMLDGRGTRQASEEVQKTCDLLASTATVKRNRLLGDIASFVALCLERGYHDDIRAACSKVGYPSINDLLAKLATRLPTSLERELDAGDSADISSLWLTAWLENVQFVSDPEYVPVHMHFYLMDDSDWTPEFLEAASALVAVAQFMYTVLT